MNKRSVEVQDGEYYVDMSKSRNVQFGNWQRLTMQSAKLYAAMRAVMILFLLVCRGWYGN